MRRSRPYQPDAVAEDPAIDRPLRSREMGLSAVFAVTAEPMGYAVFVSDSIYEILGYRPSQLLGKSIWLVFHPDEFEVRKQFQAHAYAEELMGAVLYMRILHNRGYYVDAAVSFSVCYDVTVGIVTRAVSGGQLSGLSSSARHIVEMRAGMEGLFLGRSSGKDAPSPPTTPTIHSPPVTATPDQTPDPLRKKAADPPNLKWTEEAWKRQLEMRTPRTFLLLDRFSEAANIIFSSNALIVSGPAVSGYSFYSVVRPRDRPLVRKWLDSAKKQSPVVWENGETAGYGFLEFDVLKIPDLPPQGAHMPNGTEATEKSMPGQQFTPVEGVFQASSDGIVVILSLPKADGAAESGLVVSDDHDVDSESDEDADEEDRDIRNQPVTWRSSPGRPGRS